MTILQKLANSQNIYENVKLCIKTKSYDNVLDVLRQQVQDDRRGLIYKIKS